MRSFSRVYMICNCMYIPDLIVPGGSQSQPGRLQCECFDKRLPAGAGYRALQRACGSIAFGDLVCRCGAPSGGRDGPRPPSILANRPWCLTSRRCPMPTRMAWQPRPPLHGSLLLRSDQSHLGLKLWADWHTLACGIMFMQLCYLNVGCRSMQRHCLSFHQRRWRSTTAGGRLGGKVHHGTAMPRLRALQPRVMDPMSCKRCSSGTLEIGFAGCVAAERARCSPRTPCMHHLVCTQQSRRHQVCAA